MKDYLRGLVQRARGEGAVIRPISRSIFTPAPGLLAPEARFDDPSPGYATRSAVRARSRQIAEPAPSLPSPWASTRATGAPPPTPALSSPQPDAPVPPAAGAVSPADPAAQLARPTATPAAGGQRAPLIAMDDLAGDVPAPSESAHGAASEPSSRTTLGQTARPTTDPLDAGGELGQTAPAGRSSWERETPAPEDTPWEREHLARTSAPAPGTTDILVRVAASPPRPFAGYTDEGEQDARALRRLAARAVEFAAASTPEADGPIARSEPGTGHAVALPVTAPAGAMMEERPAAEARPVDRHGADLANHDRDLVPIVTQARSAALASAALVSPRPPGATPDGGWIDAAPAPTIHVSIGRVEVRAVQPPAPAPPRAPSGPRVSLDDYLRQRDGREGR